MRYAFQHPWRAFGYALRRLVLRFDARHPELPTTLPPELDRFDVGETLPWKGVSFRVGKIIGGEFPMVILVPNGRTRGAKLRRLRNLRDAGRDYRDEQRAIRKSLAEATR